MVSRCFPWLTVAYRSFPCAFPLLIFANLCVPGPGVPACSMLIDANQCWCVSVLSCVCACVCCVCVCAAFFFASSFQAFGASVLVRGRVLPRVCSCVEVAWVTLRDPLRIPLCETLACSVLCARSLLTVCKLFIVPSRCFSLLPAPYPLRSGLYFCVWTPVSTRPVVCFFRCPVYQKIDR